MPKLRQEHYQTLFYALWTLLRLSLLFSSSSVFADATTAATNVPNLQTMITNFASAVPNLMRLITAADYVMGMFFIIMAITKMKHLGEMRTQTSQEHGFMGPIICFLVGSAMLFLPSTVQMGLYTFYQDTNPYSYNTGQTDSYSLFLNAAYSIIQVIGVIAFIRGLLILNQAGGERSSPGQIGKALSHLVGGILCINIYNTLQILQNSVGMTGGSILSTVTSITGP